MHLLLIVLVFGIFLHDAFLRSVEASAVRHAPTLLALVLLPKLVLAGGYWLACRRTAKRLSRPKAHRAMLHLDRMGAIYRTVVIVLWGLDLTSGWLLWLRGTVGDLILIDELLAMTPTLALLVWHWWAIYPIERRIREASLISRLDAGLPIYPIWTRPQYLIAQLRHQVALVLVPLLLIIAWIETVDRLVPGDWPGLPIDPRPVLLFAGAGTIFLLTPLIIRHLWDTTPLPAGELRDRLVAMCRRHRVGVRELLLWRTFGGMINAAVMGLIAPLRYILLTDGLLERVRRDEVEAVMAHELAHVRRHHMLWLLLAAIGSLGVLELAFGVLFATASTLLPEPPEPILVMRAGFGPELAQLLRSPEAVVLATMAATGLTWVAVFGWVSRRIERQADTFAVQHLATAREPTVRDDWGRVVVDAASVATMVSALQQVADLNQIPIRKRSWRHGSIAWRQRYLRSLIGRPVDDLPIDRQMRLIHFGSLLAIAAVIAAHVWLSTTTTLI